MHKILLDLEFYKPVEAASSGFSRNPSGQWHLKRMLASLPAFKTSALESAGQNEKILLLGDINSSWLPSEDADMLLMLMLLRWLLENRFVIYQEDKDGPIALDMFFTEVPEFDNDSARLEYQLTNTDTGLGIPVSDIKLIDAPILIKIFQAFKESVVPRVLWQRDLQILGQVTGVDVDVDEVITKLSFTAGVNSIYRKDVPLLISREDFPVATMIHEADFSQITNDCDLQHLNFLYVDHDDEEKLYELLNRTPLLTRIHFSVTNQLTANEIRRIAQQCPLIESITSGDSHLDLSQHSLTLTELTIALKEARGIQSLSIVYSEAFFLLIEKELAFQKILETLEINSHLSRKDFARIIPVFPKLTSLIFDPNQKVIDFRDTPPLDFRFFIENVGISFRNIQKIIFGKFLPHNLSDFLVDFDNLPNLLEIDCSESGYLPSCIVFVFIKIAPNLEKISFQSCNLSLCDDMISIRGIRLFSARGRSLQNLESSDLQWLLDLLVTLKAELAKRGVELLDEETIYSTDSAPTTKGSMGSNRSLLNAQETADIDTAFKETTFHLKRIFYSIGPAAQHPDPAFYRLQCFNKITWSPNEQAFNWSQTGNPEFIEPSPIQFSDQDVYHQEAHRKSTVAQCHYAKVSLSLSGEWQAIPSLHAGEIITHLHIEPPISVEIQYSKRDQLYYIKHGNDFSTNVTIDYFVESHTTNADPSQDVSLLIAFFKTFGLGTLDMSNVLNPNENDYVLAMLQKKVGSCRHRALLFLALIQNPELAKSIPELKDINFEGIIARSIVNDCHEYIEVMEKDGSWVTCDLGGYTLSSKRSMTATHPCFIRRA